MGLYDTFMKPLELLHFEDIRSELIPQATGRVLEIGIGTGANLPFYNYDNISEVIGVDVRINKSIQNKLNLKVKVQQITGDTLPFDDDTFDCIVGTLVLCSVGDLDAYIREIKRVLNPNGIIIFIEHIRPREAPLSNIVDKVAGVWKAVSKECSIDKQTDKALSNTFDMVSLKYSAKTFVCSGIAKNKK